MNFCDGTIWMTSPARIAALHRVTIVSNSASVISGLNGDRPRRSGAAPPAGTANFAIDSALRSRA